MNDFLKDYFLLVILQGVNFLIPLTIFPFLSKTLGLELFGVVIFAQSLAMLVHVFVEFGFSLSATKDIALNTNSQEKLGEIVSTVFTIKLLILVACFVIYFLAVYYCDSLYSYSEVFLLSFLIVVGQVFIPTWLYLGLGRAKHNVAIRLLAQFSTLTVLLCVVDGKEDYLLVPVAYFIGHLIGSMASLFMISYVYKIDLSFQSLDTILSTIKNSSHYFLSRLFYDGSQFLVISLLGFAFKSETVAYYAAAEKFYVALNGVFSPLSQLIYPYMVKTRDIILFKRVMAMTISFLAISSLALLMNVELLSELLSGESRPEIIILSRVLIVASVVSVLSIFIGYPLLGAFDHHAYVNNSVIIGALLYIPLIIISIYIYENVYYVAISFVINQMFILLYRAHYICKFRVLN